MVAPALPALKLVGLVVKTLAKPVSKRIKHEFSRYSFTQNLLIQIGQTTHALTSRLTIWSAGYTVRKIQPLPEETAKTNGAEFVGEAFILSVSIGWLIYEVNLSNEKTAQKELQYREKAQAERMELQAKLKALDVRLKAVEDVVTKSGGALSLLPPVLSGQSKYKPPDEKDVVPIVLKGTEVEDTGENKKDENTIKGTEIGNVHEKLEQTNQSQQVQGGGWLKWLFPW